MKTNKSTLIYLTLLVTLIAGATLTPLQAGLEIKANVTWDPKNYTWDGPPNPWYAEVWLTAGYKAQTDINHTTILLEGLYPPSAPPFNATHAPRLIIPFNGIDVKNLLYLKISHEGILVPGRYRVGLAIIGNLTSTYGGLPFRGEGVIVVTVPEGPPP